MEIGIDIELIERFNLKKDDPFINSNFTKNEIDYAYSQAKPSQHLCGFFCAKEALIKTVKTQILFKFIEINHFNTGKPFIVILKKELKDKNFLLSISHCNKYSTAVVICT